MKDYSAIEQMYYGKRGQGQHIQLSEKYSELYAKYMELDTRMIHKLSGYPELFELYAQVQNAFVDVQGEAQKTEYEEGFRFGVLMGLDILREN